jgi:hypothetical protein
MQDFFNLVMLICATIAALGVGVFAAYAIFRAGFSLMRWHTQQQAPTQIKPSTEVAPAS